MSNSGEMSKRANGTHLGRVATVRFLIVVGLLGGCGLSDSDEYLECRCVSYDVTSVTDFDRLLVMMSTRRHSEGPAPLTPAMLAAGEPAPVTFEIDLGGALSDRSFAPPVRSSVIDHAHPWIDEKAVLAIGFDHGAIVGADYASLHYERRGDSYYLAEGSLVLDPTFATEVWGMQGVTEFGGPMSTCVRIAKPGLTRYFVRAYDRDCDAILNDDDCKPTEYCDPAATSPAGIAACRCT